MAKESAVRLTGPEYEDARAKDVQTPETPTQRTHRVRPLNILIINSDTYRYDNLFDRATMPVSTPNLDAFSERAVSMSNFYTGSFPTIPERTDLISGRYAWPWVPWQYLDSDNIMPQMLNKRSYVTQLICDCPHLFNFGFNRVFNAAFQVRGQEGDMALLHMNDPIEQVMPREKTRSGHHFQDRILVDLHRWTNRYSRCEEDTFPARTSNHVVRWLEENNQHRPFFVWVDFFDPHEPWDPPEYMVRKYNPDYNGTPMLHPNYGEATDYTPEELLNLRAHYCAEAELIDRWDSTIVIFTTEHGMSLGEHNRTGKSNNNDRDNRRWPLYPEVAHIPFLIAVPGIVGGETRDLLVQPVDILPTLIDLSGLGIDAPAPFHGRSFAPTLRGESQAPLRDFAICGCYLRLEEGKVPSSASTPVVYSHKWAYAPIGPDGAAELFDLENDPYAEVNLAAEHPDVAAKMHQQLIQWLRDLGAPEEAIEVYI